MKHIFAATAALALAMPASLQADDGDTPALSPADQAEKDKLDRVIRKRDLLKAQAEIAEQYAGLVPTLTESISTLSGDNAGALEVAFMGTPVIAASAQKIAGYLLKEVEKEGSTHHVILLEGNEAKPWGETQLFEQLIDQRTTDLEDKHKKALASGDPSRAPASGGEAKSGDNPKIVPPLIPLASELASAVSKVFATETVLSAVPFKAPDGQLMRFLRVMNKGFRRAEPEGSVKEDNPLITKFNALGDLVAKSTKTLSAANAAATAQNPLRSEYVALSESIALAKVLIKQLGTPNDNGRMPIIAAARYAELLKGEPLIARVHTDFAGGSVIQKKSFATRYLGYDGVRLTAGMVSSYEIEKLDGTSVAVGFVQCRAPYQFVSDAVDKGPGTDTATLEIDKIECAHTAIPTNVPAAGVAPAP